MVILFKALYDRQLTELLAGKVFSCWHLLSPPFKCHSNAWNNEMLELAILACLHDNPTKCKDVSLLYMAESITPMQCMSASQAEIAKWTMYHPRWFAKKWSCRAAGIYAKA